MGKKDTAFPCPVCGASAGQNCQTGGGKSYPAGQEHANRPKD